MWELLRDPIWEGIGAAIGLVGVVSAIVLGVVLFRLQRRRKELRYRVLSQSRVVSMEAQGPEDVVMMRGGERIPDVHLVMLELVNSGNQPIIPDDYHYPLQINLGEGAEVLTADQVDSKPKGIAASPSITESLETVRVDAVLLNPGDSFTLKFLVTQYGGTLDVAAHIVGVKEIRILGEERARVAAAVQSWALVSAVAVCWGVIWAHRDEFDDPALIDGPSGYATIVMLLVLVVSGVLAGIFSVMEWLWPILKKRWWPGSHGAGP